MTRCKICKKKLGHPRELKGHYAKKHPSEYENMKKFINKSMSVQGDPIESQAKHFRKKKHVGWGASIHRRVI